jgi:hypothetical protein
MPAKKALHRKVQKRRTEEKKRKIPHADRASIPSSASSYAELLVFAASSGKDHSIESASFALHSLLCCASERNIALAKRLGIFVGRTIYSGTGNRSTGINDYLDKLSMFFDASGFDSSYHIFPHQIEFDVWEERQSEIGAISHPFEAGIVSGFLSAVFKDHIDVTEEGCRYFGSWSCRFITNVISPAKTLPASNASLENLIIHMRDSRETSNKISLAYDRLLLSLLSKPDFQPDAFMLMETFGQAARRICPTDKHYITKWLNIIGLGSVSVRDKFIYVQLDKSVSRMEIARLIGAFISGLLDKHPIKIEISLDKDSYRLRFER